MDYLDSNAGLEGEGEYGDMEKECPDFNYKIILVGHARVGKTSITNRFVNDYFNENEKSTRTVQISKKVIKIENTQNKFT
jgi:GTPase SAR1 family protein